MRSCTSLRQLWLIMQRTSEGSHVPRIPPQVGRYRLPQLRAPSAEDLLVVAMERILSAKMRTVGVWLSLTDAGSGKVRRS